MDSILEELREKYPELKSTGLGARHLALFNEHELMAYLGVNEDRAIDILRSVRRLLREARELSGRRMISLASARRKTIRVGGLSFPAGLYSIRGEARWLFLGKLTSSFLKAFNSSSALYVDCESSFDPDDIRGGEDVLARMGVYSPATYEELEDFLVFDVPSRLEGGDLKMLIVDGVDSIVGGIPDEEMRISYVRYLADWVRRLTIMYDLWSFIGVRSGYNFLPGRPISTAQKEGHLVVEVMGRTWRYRMG